MGQQQNRGDVYARVTAQIVSEIEGGTRPWVKPWISGDALPMALPMRHNGTPYRGINVLLLWSAAFERGFQSSTWMTYKQAQALGGQVRKGETASMVVYADRITKTETAADGEETEREVAFMKAYSVFNVAQIDHLPESYQAKAIEPEPTVGATIERAERFFALTGADIRHGGDRAFYAIAPDFIQLPHAADFFDAESYTATKAHELIHWTGHTSRLGRDFGGKRFGDHGYATEELVAELGAAFLCADLGITAEPRPDHASYLASWLRALKNDKRLIFTAAAHAQRALDFVHALQPEGQAPIAA